MMLGKSLFEIANSEGNVGLGLPGAYCVRTSTHRNTTRRGEERNRLLGISSLRSSSDGDLRDNGSQSGIPRAAAATSLWTLLEVQISATPDSVNWKL